MFCYNHYLYCYLLLPKTAIIQAVVNVRGNVGYIWLYIFCNISTFCYIYHNCYLYCQGRQLFRRW